MNASCASNLDQLNYACMRIACLLQPTRDTPTLHSPGAPHASCNFSSAHSLAFLSYFGKTMGTGVFQWVCHAIACMPST